MRCAFLGLVLSTLTTIPGVTADLVPVKGAGATTATAVVTAWSKAYVGKGGPAVEYETTGSVVGLERLTSGAAQFALSDAWISVPDLAAKELVQFPVLLEGIVPIVNVAGLAPGALRLTGPVLGDIYLGKIKNWNAPPIADLNPGVTLPMTPITVVHRSDGSGSTFLFTSYLNAVNPAWKGAVGSGTEVKWPVGAAVSGSDAMVQKVKTTDGAFGYVDFGRVRKQQLTYVTLKNHDGELVAPTASGIANAAASAPWATAPAFAVLLVEQGGKATWPISGAVFAVTKRQQDQAVGRSVLGFFDFALGDGAQIARDLGYVVLPDSVTRVVRDAWPRLVKTTAGVSVWTGGR
jgi:phosphate transport system substrate-binding protein